MTRVVTLPNSGSDARWTLGGVAAVGSLFAAIGLTLRRLAARASPKR